MGFVDTSWRDLLDPIWLSTSGWLANSDISYPHLGIDPIFVWRILWEKANWEKSTGREWREVAYLNYIPPTIYDMYFNIWSDSDLEDSLSWIEKDQIQEIGRKFEKLKIGRYKCFYGHYYDQNLLYQKLMSCDKNRSLLQKSPVMTPLRMRNRCFPIAVIYFLLQF